MCPGFKSLHRHHPLLKRFRLELKAAPIQDGQRVLLAVSGGGDSVGLLALFLSARPRPDVTLGVAHVHHNLRGPEADRDEAAVRTLADALGLPFLHARLRGKPPAGKSLEEWAREGRYAALERLRVKGRWDWVSTAHSLDDQAETVLMRIARGTGLDGLASIRPLTGSVVRPALAFSGAELREAARTCGLRFLEDSTNRDRRFLRNRVRLEVLPAIERSLPGFSRRLASLARLAVEGSSRRCPEVAVLEGDTLYYPCEVLSGISEAEALEAFRSGLRSLMGHLRRIGEAHVRALWALRTTRPGGRVDLPGNWEGVREKEGIRLRRHARPARKERP